MTQKLFVHETTYKGLSLISLIHKNRLKAILKLFCQYLPETEISWADFGSSNGFIPEEIVKTQKFKFRKIVGYDNEEGLLEIARAKKISNGEFYYFDMNSVTKGGETFDLVTCFETLEHVGDFKNAFVNLFNHTKDQGILIVTVPNETGLPGLFKFIGRLIFRRNPYRDFFADQSYYDYLKALVKNDFIDQYRKADQKGYGPHLGFDYRQLENHIRFNFLNNQQLKLMEKSFTCFKMNLIYVLKKE